MRSLFSLVVMVIVGYMAWTYIGPFVQQHMPAIPQAAAAPLSCIAQGMNQVRDIY